MLTNPIEPDRIRRVELPERGRFADDATVWQADLALLACAPENFLDTTHFDTTRFPPPPWAAETFLRAAKDGALAYTPYRGDKSVLRPLAENLSTLLGVSVDPDQHVLITPGTQAGLFAALASLVEDGQRVALVDPDYLFSERILRFHGAEIAYVPLQLGRAFEPTIDLAALEKEFAFKGTRLLVFSHPNNPTGAVYSADTLNTIARLCLKYGVTVVVDELYCRLIYDGRIFPHLAGFPGMADQVVTLLGPSKTESLTGYRVGVVVAPSSIAARIEKVLSILSLRAPAYAQHLLVHWLRDDEGWLADRIKELSALRALTAARLRELPWLKWTPQGGTAYAWPDVSALNAPDSSLASTLLRDAHVLVNPGYQFGSNGVGHFRVCYARDENVWQAALDRMIEVLHRLAKHHRVMGM